MDNEVKDSKGQDIKRTMDETKFEIRVHKQPSFNPQSQATLEVSEIP